MCDFRCYGRCLCNCWWWYGGCDSHYCRWHHFDALITNSTVFTWPFLLHVFDLSTFHWSGKVLKPVRLRSFFSRFFSVTACILLISTVLEMWDSLHCFWVNEYVSVGSYFNFQCERWFSILSRVCYSSHQVRSTFIWSYVVYFSAFTLWQVLWLVQTVLDTHAIEWLLSCFGNAWAMN